MKKVILFTVILFMFITSVNLFSQSKKYFAKSNTWEIGGSFSYTNFKYVTDGNESSGITFVSFAPYCGFFITNGFELGVIPTLEVQDYDNYDISNLTVFLSPAYNFNTKSPAYPYIQGAVGYSSQWGKHMTTRSGLAWQVEAGLKYNVFSHSILKFGLNYSQKTLETTTSNDKRDGINTIGFSVGFNVFFR